MGCLASQPKPEKSSNPAKTQKKEQKIITSHPSIEPNLIQALIEPIPIPIQVNNPENVSRKTKQQVGQQKYIKQSLSLENIQENEIAVKNARLFAVTKRQKLNTLMHRSIVAITGSKRNSCMVIRGSGVMLSKNIILTVAHNILDQYKKQYEKTKYRVYLQSDGQRYYQIQNWRYLYQYTTAYLSEDIEFDYAIIKLKDNPNQPVYDKYPQLSLPCPCILNKNPQLILDIYGYPVYQLNYNPLNEKGTKISLCQYGLSRQDSIVQIEKNHIIKYAISTLIGQSGSPIFLDNKVIAVHKAGKIKQQCNAGRLLTKDMMNNIQKWCKQLNGDPIRLKVNDKCWHKKQKLIQLQSILHKLKTSYLQFAMSQISFINLYNKEVEHLQELALYYESQSNFAKAIELYQESLKIKESVNEKDSLQLVNFIQKIALLYQKNLNYGKSLDYFNKSLYIKERKKGKGCIQSAINFHRMGWIYHILKNDDKCFDFYKTAISIYQKAKGKGCLQSANTLNNMGVVYSNRKDEKALQCYSQALQIQERTKGKGCYQSANTLNNMGIYYNNELNYSMAIGCYTLSLQIYERFKGKGCQESKAILVSLGTAHKKQKNYFMCLKYYTQALQIYSKRKNIIESVQVLQYMGQVYNQQLNYNKSLDCYGQALKILQTSKGKGSYQSANILREMGSVYFNKLDYDKALEHYSQTLKIQESSKGRQCLESVATLNNMGIAYYHQGNYTMALQCYIMSVQINKRLKGNQVVFGATMRNIGNVHSDLMNYEQAEKMYQISLQVFQNRDLYTEAKDTAVKLAKCLKYLKKQENLSQIIKKYGLESLKFD